MRAALACVALAPLASASVALVGPAAAEGGAPRRQVEVVAVRGLVDGPALRAVSRALEAAERGGAEALVVQLDVTGSVDGGGTQRVVRRLVAARVPVVAWVAPPGARAAEAGALLAEAAHLVAMAPGTSLGPAHLLDLRRPRMRAGRLLAEVAQARGRAAERLGRARPFSAAEAQQAGLADVLALQLPDLLQALDGREVSLAGGGRVLHTDPSGLAVRFRKLDLLGRAQHAVAQPSIAFLLLLAGIVGLVFEVFHPQTGPAGLAGAAGVAGGLYGLVVLDGSWLGLALVVAGVVAMSVDLRYETLGLLTAGGAALFGAGCWLLFPNPRLRVAPGVLAVGIVGMLLFMVAVMTRVLRDLRAIARGELVPRDPHPVAE